MIWLVAAGVLFLDGGSSSVETGAVFGRVAGGAAGVVVAIPTALRDSALNEANLRAMPEMMGKYFGVGRVVVLHAQSREEANGDAFAAPLQGATGVYFMGGDHKRILERYKGTRFERAVREFYAGGGTVGGSSAGAMVMGTLQAERPGRRGSTIEDSGDRGFGLLADAMIDVHFSERRRQRDVRAVLRRNKSLLVVGLDEKTAAIVREGELTVAGRGTVTVYAGGRVRVLRAGERAPISR